MSFFVFNSKKLKIPDSSIRNFLSGFIKKRIEKNESSVKILYKDSKDNSIKEKSVFIKIIDFQIFKIDFLEIKRIQLPFIFGFIEEEEKKEVILYISDNLEIKRVYADILEYISYKKIKKEAEYECYSLLEEDLNEPILNLLSLYYKEKREKRNIFINFDEKANEKIAKGAKSKIFENIEKYLSLLGEEFKKRGIEPQTCLDFFDLERVFENFKKPIIEIKIK